MQSHFIPGRQNDVDSQLRASSSQSNPSGGGSVSGNERLSIMHGGDSAAAPSAAINSNIPIGEQLMQVDQEITLTLQEIDANFANTHQIITSRILPAIKRYGVASHNTWQGAKLWHRFFETASDIHLAPPRADQETTFGEGDNDEGENNDDDGGDITQQQAHGYAQGRAINDAEYSLSLDSEETVAAKQKVQTGRRSKQNDPDSIDDDDILEPPRLSDASKAATARLQRSGRDEHRINVKDTVDVGADVYDAFDSLTVAGRPRRPSSPPKSGRKSNERLITSVLRGQHEGNAGSSTKVMATPKRGGKVHNPFFAAAAPPTTTKSATDRAQRNSIHSKSPRWNGIADLRNTPLIKVNPKRNAKSTMDAVSSSRWKGKGNAQQGQGANLDDDDEDSLAWPAGMSPPVTMQFSVPRSRYNKTPAKEAARLVVDDLLRTVEGATPAAVRRLVQERESQGKSSQRAHSGTDDVQSRTPAGKADDAARRLRKGRPSMPTPPTITKRVTTSSRKSGEGGAKQPQRQRESTPKGHAAQSASRLMDEGEEGQSFRGAPGPITASKGGERSNNDGMRALETGLDRLGFDKMLDDEDSDNDLDDSDEDEDDEDDMVLSSHHNSSLPSLSASKPPKSTAPRSLLERSSGLTASSISHSIDEDTLFGIREPSSLHSDHATSPVEARDQHRSGQISATVGSGGGGGGNRSDAQRFTSSSSSTITDTAAKAASAATPSAQVFKPMGHVQSMGTVYRGRPLLDEGRDVTYSVPSPTPAGSQRRAAD